MTILSSLHFQFCPGRLSCHEYLECNLNGDFSPKGLSLTLEKGLFILIAGFEKKSLNLTIIVSRNWYDYADLEVLIRTVMWAGSKAYQRGLISSQGH